MLCGDVSYFISGVNLLFMCEFASTYNWWHVFFMGCVIGEAYWVFSDIYFVDFVIDIIFLPWKMKCACDSKI